METRERSARPPTAGYAMLVVLVFTSISLVAVTSTYDRIQQLYVFEEASDRIPDGEDGLQEALGSGLARLQIGEPTVNGSNKYICDLPLRSSDGTSVAKYRLIYKKLRRNRWWLRARPAGAAKPVCPPVFTDQACPAP